MKKLTIKKGTTLHEKLSRLHRPPAELYVEGADLEILVEKPIVAVVGSRKMSSYGRAVTEKIVHDLAHNGVVVVSGLAYGVDICAHKTCLEARGSTIAVLPSSISEIYPRAHQQTANAIVQNNGCLVSEYRDGSVLGKYSFIERNRIIAGLSDVVIIPEATEKSGSLHTAGFALDLGITVASVPGPITSELSSGTNRLIQQGASTITSSEDVLNLLGIDTQNKTAANLLGDTEEESLILRLIHEGVCDVDELAIVSKLETALFQRTITMLEINGQITAIGGGKWRLQ